MSKSAFCLVQPSRPGATMQLSSALPSAGNMGISHTWQYGCFKFLLNLCFRLSKFVLTWMFIHHVCAWCLWNPQEGVGSLVTRVMIAVSCHMDPGNQTQVLWKSSRYSKALSHLSSLLFFFFCKKKNLVSLGIQLNWQSASLACKKPQVLSPVPYKHGMVHMPVILALKEEVHWSNTSKFKCQEF